MKEESPDLNPKYKQKPFFSTPPGYFDYMASRAKARMKQERRPLLAPWMRPALASVVAVLVCIGLYFVNQSANDNPNNTASATLTEEVVLDYVEADELIALLQETPARRAVKPELQPEAASDDEMKQIEDYLLEEADAELLYEELSL